MSGLIPVAMDSTELAMVLDDMMKRVLDGDSYEGSIEYLIPEPGAPEGWPDLTAEFWVRGTYRIGNLQGQGGMRMIGTVPS